MTPDHDIFLRDHWLPRKPCLIKNLVNPECLKKISLNEILSHSHAPVNVDRYFGSDSPDKADRIRLKQAELAPLAFQRSRSRNSADIYYFFGLRDVWPVLDSVISDLPFGYSWRSYMDLGSLSTPDSTIHAHADMIDTLIIQLMEPRRWFVWEPTQNKEIIKGLNDNGPTPRFKTTETPVMEVDLEPGSALYIPALWPHSATISQTSEPSFSISVGWSALTPARVLNAVLEEADWQTCAEAYEADPDVFTALLEDPESEEEYPKALAEQIYPALPNKVQATFDLDELAARIGKADLGRLASTKIRTLDQRQST